MRISLRCGAIGAAVYLIVPASLWAQSDDVGQPDAFLDLQVSQGQTDNLGRDETVVRSDLSLLGLAFLAGVDRPRLDGIIIGDVQARYYGSNQVVDDDEIVGSVDGNLAVQLVPETFVMELQQNYGQVRGDPLRPASINNRDRTSVSSVAPRLQLSAGSRNVLVLSGRVSERNYEKSSEFDGRTTSAQLGVTRALDDVTSITATLDSWESEFDSSFAAYEYESVSLSYSKQFASGGVELRVGRGEIDTQVTNNTTSVGTFAWSRGIGSRSQITAWASREYTDAGELFRLGGVPATTYVSLADVPGSSPVGTQSNRRDATTNDSRIEAVTLTANPTLRSTAGARVALDGRRTDISLAIEKSRDRTEVDNSLDSDAVSFSLSVTRELSGRWQLALLLRTIEDDFVVQQISNKDRFVSVTADYAVGARSKLSVGFDRTRRRGGFVPFDENVYLVAFTYSIGRER